ncbi:MAG: ferredoxin:protochlorophyllide reductase (ATP-dependent) subunit B [Deltaproteobacteria bacterium]|nr:ferredoxin:protochlorophyllide reductase (ATP-dependent) subunit B [Nannocystaceae bacterium]
MQLSVWTYEGPPHVGAMRIATAMKGVHFLLHAPQGDTYADLLFTMIERRSERPPVTYTTFAARDLGSDTAELFKTAARDAYERFSPELMLVGASCTAELIQDDPGGIAVALGLPVPVVALELSAYQRRENWGAAHTFYKLVRACCSPEPRTPIAGARKRCNLLGATALGFRHRDDIVELTRLLEQLGVDVNVVAPYGARPSDLARLGDADFNVMMYPEIAEPVTRWLGKTFAQPCLMPPLGVNGTKAFCEQVAAITGVDANTVIDQADCRLPWYSRSVDSTYLTRKQVFVFGEGSRAIAAARIATEELGFEVIGLGTYSREQARDVRAAAVGYGLEALITEDHLEVEDRIAALHPELVLGTQMERHIAKRLGLPCAVISAPVHVQDFPARYSPQMGFEGANVLFDTWVHPLMMGLEEHLLAMFREDFEFTDGLAPSHLGGSAATSEPAPTPTAPAAVPAPESATTVDALSWTPEAERELKKIPFFVRGKARRNTERFAREFGRTPITLETLYDAKAHFQA